MQQEPVAEHAKSRLSFRNVCAALLGMDIAKLKVTSSEIGGGFGGKTHVWMEPVALALSTDGRRLYTANRDSGSISVIETATDRVAEEIDLGGRLTDLAAFDDTALLALDAGNHQLVLLTRSDQRWRPLVRLGLPGSPQRLLVDRTNRRCYVSSAWSRVLSVVDLAFHRLSCRLSFRLSCRLSFRLSCRGARGGISTTGDRPRRKGSRRVRRLNRNRLSRPTSSAVLAPGRPW